MNLVQTIPTMVRLGLCLCLGDAAARAATWSVAPPPNGSDTNPGTEQQPFATIQKGIDAANAGDTVVVASGTYRENIQFKGKNIVLRSADPPNAAVRSATVIDGGQLGPCVAFAGTEDDTCALSGFTLRKGAATGGHGGGIRGGAGELHTRAAVQLNHVSDNYGDCGGGLCGCAGPILNCIIWGNTASNRPALYQSSTPTYSCIQNWPGGGLGNTAADPQFANAAKDDYRLLPSSPGIDAGDSTALNLPATDFLGRPRVLFGGRRLAVDLGAYEFIPTTCTLGPGPGQATVTWGSLASKTYSLFYSHDLRQWQLANDRVESAGNLTSAWTDDGTQTTPPPSAVPCRFYRCVENP